MYDQSNHDSMKTTRDNRYEYEKTNRISDPAIAFNRETYNPWLIPENPFDYVGLISNPNGIGSVPQDNLGAKVAIIGAGCAGLSAAYELMKIGLQPVVYELATEPNDKTKIRIGGRTFSYYFPGDPKAFAEIGAMRIPTATQKTTGFYIRKFGIDHSERFPDPLTVPTTLYLKGKRHFIDVAKGKLSSPLPFSIQKVIEKWQSLVQPVVETMQAARSDPLSRSIQWRKFVTQYANKSFFEVLAESGWSDADIELFGLIGIGSGGFNSVYPVSFLEILRIVVCGWEEDQRLIKGGVTQIPMGFWTRQRNCAHWGKKSVKELHAFNNGEPLPGVMAISTAPSGKIIVTCSLGSEEYTAAIVSCSPRALEMGIQVDESIFSQKVWAAIRDIHMICSTKVFIRTKSAFWTENPHDPNTLHCTLTDLASRQIYLFDFPDITESGVICLSYTWEDSSVKFDALTSNERVEKCIRDIAQIYGSKMAERIQKEQQESISWSWQKAHGYNGAFKLTYPSQYDEQWTLFLQPITTTQPVYLAGEAVSWASGWVEGAFHTGLDAAMVIILQLGGVIK